MTGVWGVREVLNASIAQNNTLQAEQRWLDEQLAVHQGDLRAIDGEAQAAWQHLGEVLVPALDRAVLDRAAAACQLPSVSAAAVDLSLHAESDRLHRQLAEIDATPDYAEREGLNVECDLRIAEYDEMLKPWHDDAASIHREPAWQRLRDAHYGTPEYAAKWFQLTYYRDWKQADELVERHGAKFNATTWEALRGKALAAEAAMATLGIEREEFVTRRRRIADLVRSHRDIEQSLQTLPARTLAGVRGRLRSHLEPLGLERLTQFLAADPAVALALQRLAGLAAKRRYLVEAAEQYLLGPRQQISAAITRNNRDLHKLSRPKNASRTFPAAAMEKRFRDRSSAVGKRRQRWDDTRTHVVEFNNYDRGSLAQDFLWWDLMTDGRLDGDFIPEVHDHYERYPDRDRHADAVAAVASEPAHDDLLSHDGS